MYKLLCITYIEYIDIRNTLQNMLSLDVFKILFNTIILYIFI